MMSLQIKIFLGLFIVLSCHGLIQNGNNSCQSNFLSLFHLITNESVERRLSEAELHEKIRVLEAKLNNIAAKPSIGETQIAFSGMLSRKIPRSEWGQIVKFDVVTTNIGNAYNILTGKFRCPVAGLYLFSCSILGDASSQAILEMYQNGVKIARPYSGHGTRGTQSYPWGTQSGSDTTVVHAAVGDEVYSKVTAGGASYLDNFSRFTAVLLKAD